MQTQTQTKYQQFLELKKLSHIATGFLVEESEINPLLFDWQKQVVAWAVGKGRAALFADCGLGKTAQQLEWAKKVALHTHKPVIILTPLAVAQQTLREASKFNIDADMTVIVAQTQEHVPDGPCIVITNYEKLARFDVSVFGGVVLDESSILKSYSGATRNLIIESFTNTPFKLACTATPSPNDFMELGNHAEFLGVMSRTEMLATYFVHDGGETSKWRLKGHAESEFWKWVCSWAVMMRRPSDIGFSDEGFHVPPLEIIEHRVAAFEAPEGQLFATAAQTLSERRVARRESLNERAEAAAAQIAIWQAENPDESILVFCDFNNEGDLLEKLVAGSVQVAGSDKDSHKERAFLEFANGDLKVLVSKPSICGFGMNFQRCAKIVFVGISDSFEQFYQAVRRCWRFGQTREVECHIYFSEVESNVVDNIKRKNDDMEKMVDAMTAHLREMGLSIDGASQRDSMVYMQRVEQGANWTAILGDSVESVGAMDSDSIDYSIFSPPFDSLYTYSNSERDMGNCRDSKEFEAQFSFLITELFRVMKSGRLVSFHCMNLPTSKERDGVIGIRDFRGEMIRLFQSAGFIYHSEVCIWKDPVTAMQRTKALGLLHKTIKKDSSMSRQGIADYLVAMRKPGLNENPIAGGFEEYRGEDGERIESAVRETLSRAGNRMTPEDALSVNIWQRYASPVWMDINPSDTLQKESARDEKDERHICPLQLEVIRRGLQLWSNKGDTILTPFGGIGSEGYVAVEMGRKAILCELKPKYFTQLVANMRRAEISTSQLSIFDELEEAA